MRTRRRLLPCILALALAGCDADAVAPQCSRPAEFSVSPSGLVELLVGQTFTVVASHGYPCGAQAGPVVWRSSNPSVGVRALSPGEAKIIAIAPGAAAVQALQPNGTEAWAGVSVRVMAIPVH